AHFGLAFASPPAQNALGSPLIVTRRLIKQKARHHPASSTNSVIFEVTKHSRRSLLLLLFRISRSSWALTPCKHIISGTISLRSPRFFSPFPRCTSSLSVANEYLGLRLSRRRFIRSLTGIELLEYTF